MKFKAGRNEDTEYFSLLSPLESKGVKKLRNRGEKTQTSSLLVHRKVP